MSFLRGEVLLLFLATVLAGACVLHDLLESRVGSSPARAAAMAFAVLAPVHPAAPLVLAPLGSRGELLALCLGMLGWALFLRGRQREKDAVVVGAVVLVALSGFASSLALGLAPLLAGSEFVAVRRHRPRSVRLRTTATTLLVFGGAASLALLVWRTSGASVALAPGALRGRAFEFLEGLGTVVAPSAPGAGRFAVLWGGVLLLLAVQPAFRAVRNAPRLWSALAVTWASVLLLALGWARHEVPGRLLPAMLVWSAGLALTTTALARPWRAGLVAGVALGWGLLAHASARPLARASAELARWHADAIELARSRGPVLVLDPPELDVPGVAPAPAGWLFHPRLDPGAATDFDPLRVRALGARAFLDLVQDESFAALRARGLRVLVSSHALGRAEDTWLAIDLPAAAGGSAAVRSWHGDLTFAPGEPIDPLGAAFVRVVAELSTPPDELERLAWRTRAGPTGTLVGFQREEDVRRVVTFDLTASLAWRLAGSVRSLTLEKGVQRIESGELLPSPPALAPEVEVRLADDDCALDPAPTPASGATHVLSLLDLSSLRRAEFPLEIGGVDGLRARGAGAWARPLLEAGSALVWFVDYRVGDNVLRRSHGPLLPNR